MFKGMTNTMAKSMSKLMAKDSLSLSSNDTPLLFWVLSENAYQDCHLYVRNGYKNIFELFRVNALGTNFLFQNIILRPKGYLK